MEDELSGESFSTLEVYVSFFKVNSVLYAVKQFFLIVVLMVRIFSLSWRDILSEISHSVLREDHLTITGVLKIN